MDFDPFAHPEFIQDTGRSQEIERLQRYFDSTQYEGKPDWWTGAKSGGGSDDKVPLRERKPCIIYELPKAAGQQVVRFLFGDGRYPQTKVYPSESDGTLATVEVSEDDAAAVNAWLNELTARAMLKTKIRSLAKRGVCLRTAVAVLSVRRGQFKITTPRAQDCWAEFVDNDCHGEVKRLVWSYEFEREVADKQGKPTQARFRFRREWDEKNITTYEPVPVEVGKKIQWGAAQAEAHGFTFCPVVWIQNQPDDAEGSLDGVGLFDGLEDEFDALNFALSQRHRGIHYWGTPQPWQTGVEPGDGPGAEGREAAGTQGWSPAKPQHGSVAPAIKRAPEHIWNFEGQNVELGLLETTGKSFEIATKHVDDIRSRLLEQMGVVLTSMADTVNRSGVQGQMSARFLMLAHAPLLALVSELRQPWWSFGLHRILSMCLRMNTELAGKGVLIPGSEAVAEILKRHIVQAADGTSLWLPPRIEPIWGRFFEPTPEEIKQATEAAALAVKSGIMTRESAVRFIADQFGTDGEEELAALLEQDEEPEEEEPEETDDEEDDDTVDDPASENEEEDET